MKVNLTTADRERIVLTQFESLGEKGILLIASAMGIGQGYYKHIAASFARSGYVVYTFDYTGIGMSKPVKDRKACNLLNWGQRDLEMVISYCLDNHEGQDLFLLGHSIAGQIFPFAQSRNRIKRACFVGSQNVSFQYYKGRSRLLVNIFWYLVLPLANNLFQGLPGFAYGGKEKIPHHIAADWARSGRSKKGILTLLKGDNSNYLDTTVPTKFFSMEDDTLFAPKASVEQIVKMYGSRKKEHIHLIPKEYEIKEIGHFGFFRKEMSPLWTQVEEWFQKE